MSETLVLMEGAWEPTTASVKGNCFVVFAHRYTHTHTHTHTPHTHTHTHKHTHTHTHAHTHTMLVPKLAGFKFNRYLAAKGWLFPIWEANPRGSKYQVAPTGGPLCRFSPLGTLLPACMLMGVCCMEPWQGL